MRLLSDQQRRILTENGAAQSASRSKVLDFRPVVKLFDPTGASTWLLSEFLLDNPDVAFGLCDLGMGEPELGRVSLSELEAYRGRFGAKIERDLYWEAEATLSEYLSLARRYGRIVEPWEDLDGPLSHVL